MTQNSFCLGSLRLKMSHYYGNYTFWGQKAQKASHVTDKKRLIIMVEKQKQFYVDLDL